MFSVWKVFKISFEASFFSSYTFHVTRTRAKIYFFCIEHLVFNIPLSWRIHLQAILVSTNKYEPISILFSLLLFIYLTINVSKCCDKRQKSLSICK